MSVPLHRLFRISSLAFAVAAALYGQASVLTWHNDNARTGQNLKETVLSPSTVSPATFQRLFTLSVDGKVDAQPLYVPSVAIPSTGLHNVLYVVTEHDSVYAFDADTGAQLWQVSLLGSGEVTSDDRSCGQVTPEIGITSTPVIDPQMGPNGALYAIAMSKTSSGTYHQRLHAIDLTTGSELFGGPVGVQATYVGTGAEGSGGIQTFDPKQHKERAALTLLNNVVYTAWSSHCDIAPYTGWVIGYNESTLARASILNLTPNGSDGGMWAAGSGPSADSTGNLFLLMGNGTFDTTLNASGFPVYDDFGNGFMKLSTAAGLAVADYFEMSNGVSESSGDVDLGSGGAMLLPSLNDASGNPHLLAVGAGKDGHLYVVDRNSMGEFQSSVNAIYQDMPGMFGSGVYSGPAWFNGTLYYGAVSDFVKAFGFTNGKFGASPLSQSPTSFAYPGATPSISANGSTNGVVWAAENASPAVLHAYDAGNLSKELYNSNMAANGRDHFGSGNKFIVPTVVNGKVYVGTTSGVGVFGPTCSYAFVPWTAAVPSTGVTQSMKVNATAGCSWTAASNASWLSLTSGGSGQGSGTVGYSVAANSGPDERDAALTIAGQKFAVTQATAAVHPQFFAGEIYAGNSTYSLTLADANPFGFYTYLTGGWIYHADMGYEFVESGNGPEVYFWDLTSGHWLYTNSSTFPFLYDFTLTTWLYYFPNTGNPGHYTNNPRYFANMKTGIVFTM